MYTAFCLQGLRKLLYTVVHYLCSVCIKQLKLRGEGSHGKGVVLFLSKVLMCGAVCEDLLCLQHTDSPCVRQQTLEPVGAASETPY